MLVFMFGICALTHAQTEKISRLQHATAGAKNDRQLLAMDILLLEEHESIFKDSLLPLAERTFALAEKVNDKTAIGQALVGIVNANLRLDNTSRADSIIQNSRSNFQLTEKRSADVQLKLRMAHAAILATRADYENAVKVLFDIVRDAERVGDTPILARCFNELGVIAYNRDQLDDALNYYRRSLSLGESHGQADQVKAYAWINTAMVYAWRESYDTALQFINAAKPVCVRIENLYYLANVYVVEANIYKWSKRMPQAEAAMLKMLALREKTEGAITFSNEQLGLANFYVYAGECDKAISIYRNGLAYEKQRKAKGASSNFELELRYFEGLARCYHNKGARDDYENAMTQIIALKDSLYEKNSSEAIAEMQTKYEVQKKENTIIAQKYDIARKNFLFYGSLLLTALGLIIAWLLFRSYRRKSRLRLFLMQEEEKRLAQQAVKDAEEAERKRIAADLHDSLGSYAASIKSNADEMKRGRLASDPALDLLQSNAQQMVALLSDTIWAMRKDAMQLSDISDRTKLVLQRLRANYPGLSLLVKEELDVDTALPPIHAFHLFMIIQEAVINALRHSGGDRVEVCFQGGADWKVFITDNGRGMSKGTQTNGDGGNGLYNMRARAESMFCSIEWKSLQPQGTEVKLWTNSN
jgi:signal transduction histidine kinase